MSRVRGIDRQLGVPLAAALLLACGLALGYFARPGPDSPTVARVALFAAMALGGIIAFLAAGVMAVVHSLHRRIERLERRAGEADPGRDA